MPLISVIVPCYNQAQYLDECLQSILDQSYQNWECIIVNDGSPDHTEEVAKKWTEKDFRFKYIYKENGGLSSARNAGLKEAKGEWIQFLDSDDFISSSKFEIIFGNSDYQSKDLIITNFNKYNNGINPPYCKLETINFSLKEILQNWDVKFTIPIHTALIKRKSIEGILFNEKIKAKEDFLFWVEVFVRNPEVLFINEYLNFYRDHNNNMTLNYNFMLENKILAFKEIHKILDEEHKILFFNSRFETLSLENKYLYESKQELLNSKRMKIINFFINIFKNDFK